MPPTYYRGCWHVVSRGLFIGYRPYSSPIKEVYDPKAFIPHAASLRQAFAHCAISLAAASRRSWGRISVPIWLTILSDQLPVLGLVGYYPANCLMGQRPILQRPKAFIITLACEDDMRYWLRFLGDIPHWGVGYLRITKPFATALQPKSKYRSTCMH